MNRASLCCETFVYEARTKNRRYEKKPLESKGEHLDLNTYIGEWEERSKRRWSYISNYITKEINKESLNRTILWVGITFRWSSQLSRPWYSQSTWPSSFTISHSKWFVLKISVTGFQIHHRAIKTLKPRTRLIFPSDFAAKPLLIFHTLNSQNRIFFSSENVQQEL